MWMSRSTVVRACSSGGQDSSPLATSGQTLSTNVTATTLAASALMGAGSSADCDPLIEPLRAEGLQHWIMTAKRVWTFYTEKKNDKINLHVYINTSHHKHILYFYRNVSILQNLENTNNYKITTCISPGWPKMDQAAYWQYGPSTPCQLPRHETQTTHFRWSWQQFQTDN